MQVSDFEKEIKRGYNLFRVFENALELIEEYKKTESLISAKKREVEKAKKLADDAHANAEKEVAEINAANLAEIKQMKERHEAEKSHVFAELEGKEVLLKKQTAAAKSEMEKVSKQLSAARAKLETVEKALSEKTIALQSVEEKIDLMRGKVNDLLKGA